MHCKDHNPPTKAVFFDVGNTLVLQDREATLRPLYDRCVFPTAQQIKVAERAARMTLDGQIHRRREVLLDRGYWDIYYEALLAEFGIGDDELKHQLTVLAGQSGNWTILAEHAEQVLATLQKQYALGVISNSDDRLGALLANLGIDKYFSCVVASSVVGHEKPDARIFRAALECLQVEPSGATYVGDIYSVDYLGAKAAGMNAILIDTFGVYEHLQACRIRNLLELTTCLETNCPATSNR